MKIDIHTHTRKVKSGDADTRNIETAEFVEIIKNTDVKILAITNHNHFDLAQYEEFRDGVSTICQIWPGIELDILENGNRAHLIVICNPKNAVTFDKIVQETLKGKNADTFTISLKETVDKFDSLDCAYVAHYRAKKPNLGDEELDKLSTLVRNPKRILKEATNAISVGIYISHGHNSIYGSDVHDWDKYAEDSKKLPELRLPVESFEQFCLLLEKDEATINTVLNKKVKESIEITPFGIAEMISIDIYNDINILFGSKGTGKTEILAALSKYFNEKGHKTKVYRSNETHLNVVFDISGSTFNCDVSELGIENCENEIEFLKKVTEAEVVSLNKYHIHFSQQVTNKISKELKIKDINHQDETESKRSLEEITEILKEFESFEDFAEENEELVEYVDVALISELIDIVKRIVFQLKAKTENKFFENKSISLLNNIVSVISNEIAKKTGLPPKPPKTGFADYARNRIKIELAVQKILNCIKQPLNYPEEYVGSLGDKGELKCKTNLAFQNGSFTNSSFTPVKNVKKTPQKEFAKGISSISNYIHSTELFAKITDLNALDGIETITSVNDLLQKHKHFILDGELYSPSNGESSMILLHKELTDNKDIYLIDEPEKSLGNDYISEVIVPLLKEKASLGKKIVIATHDANIAVRTLPYNSIYRLHDKGKYYTMVGNPFSNALKCIRKLKPDLIWKDISMKTLEGGEAAFGERGKIYGN